MRPGRLVVGATYVDDTGGYIWAAQRPFGHLTTHDFDGDPSSYVLAASYHYGRDRFIIGDFETGTGRIILNNNSGEFSPESSVNELGGVKLRPGMWVTIEYQFSNSPYEDTINLTTYLENETGDLTWANASLAAVGDLYFKGSTRPTVNAEAWTGHVDGAAWTLHGSGSSLRAGFWRDLFDVGWMDSESVCRFLGRIYSMEDVYDEGGMGAITIVTLTDGMADLSVHTKALGSARPIELTSNRFVFLKSGVEAPFTNNLETGLFTAEATTFPNNRLAEGRLLANAEGGDLYAAHGSQAGQVTLRNANWLITSKRAATTQAVLGTGRIGITAATTKYSISRVFNDLSYENSAITATATNAASVTEYSKRTLTKTAPNSDNTDLQAITNRDLAVLKDLQFVIESVTIHPENIFEVLFAMQVAVGDRLEVTVDVNDFEYTQTLFVAGVSESWTAASNDWTLTLRLDSRDGDTVLT